MSIALGQHVAEEAPIDPGYCRCGLKLDHEDHIPAPEKTQDESGGAPAYRKRLIDFLNRNGAGTGDYRTLKDKRGSHVQYSITRESALDEDGAKQRIVDVLWLHSDKRTCRGCNADIFWIRNNINKPVPYDASGVIHFVTCPLRDRFKKGNKQTVPTRLLRDGILESRDVEKLSCEEEVFYRRLMSVVDDFGRIEADAEILRARCYPRRVSTVTLDQIEAWLTATHAAGLVEVYNVNGKRYLEFLKLGTPRAKTSKFPPPFANAQQQTLARENGCKQTQTSVPLSGSYSGSGSYSNAASSSDSDSGAVAAAAKPEPVRQKQPASIRKLEATAKTIRERFPTADDEIIARIAAAAAREYPAITDWQIANCVVTAHRGKERSQQSPALFLSTIGPVVRQWRPHMEAENARAS